jgi:hypothetical protein
LVKAIAIGGDVFQGEPAGIIHLGRFALHRPS